LRERERFRFGVWCLGLGLITTQRMPPRYTLFASHSHVTCFRKRERERERAVSDLGGQGLGRRCLPGGIYPRKHASRVQSISRERERERKREKERERERKREKARESERKREKARERERKSIHTKTHTGSVYSMSGLDLIIQSYLMLFLLRIRVYLYVYSLSLSFCPQIWSKQHRCVSLYVYSLSLFLSL